MFYGATEKCYCSFYTFNGVTDECYCSFVLPGQPSELGRMNVLLLRHEGTIEKVYINLSRVPKLPTVRMHIHTYVYWPYRFTII